MMLERNIAAQVIDHAISLGANFVELFIERHYSSTINSLSHTVESIKSGIDFGIGIRLIFDSKVLYGYINQTHPEELKRIIGLLCIKDRRDPQVSNTNFNFSTPTNTHPAKFILSGSKTEAADIVAGKIDFLFQASQHAEHKKIIQTRGFCLQREQHIEIYNSHGLHTQDTRHYTRIGLTSIAADGSTQATGGWNEGGLTGWEIEKIIDAKFMGEEASRQSLINLEAKPCPSGEMPVIIGNGFGGVIFHEACGHLLETTSVAKKASVFHDQMGEIIANPIVNAVDNGLIEHAWGSINIDDEGEPTQDTQLIENGKLVNFLADRLGSEKTGYPKTGSGRRESYRFAPTSRMRNTYIEPGNDDLDSMIASIEKGIYAAKMGGGSVQPGTGEFNFAVTEGYFIENGKIQYPIKAATLISTGPKVLKEISMIGKDFRLATGMCGSVSGLVPTTVGQPTLKVNKILVGGNA